MKNGTGPALPLWRGRYRSLRVLLVVCLLALTGCQVTTSVDVHMNRDGSGEVEVTVGLDDEALSRLPDLDGNGANDQADLTELARTADLEAAGWEVNPVSREDGITWLSVTKPFGTPEEASRILTEITGDGGPLQSLELSRSTGFAKDSYSFSGEVDLSEGLTAFGDQGLADILDGEVLGRDEAAIEADLGHPLAEAFQVTVNVDLPGAEPESWSPQLGGAPVAMEHSSTVRNMVVIMLAGVAGACLLGLVTVLIVRTIRR